MSLNGKVTRILILRASFSQMVILGQHFRAMNIVGMNIRSALVALIYRKVKLLLHV